MEYQATKTVFDLDLDWWHDTYIGYTIVEYQATKTVYILTGNMIPT